MIDMTDCVRGVAVCFASVIPEYVKGAEARVYLMERKASPASSGAQATVLRTV